MAAINFPSSPSINQVHTEAGVSWIWTGTTWDIVPTGGTNPISGSGTANYVPKFTSASDIGNSTIQDLTTGVLVSPSVTASGAIARGLYLNPSLTASANSDNLRALAIEPTFSSGGFTGIVYDGLSIRTSISGGDLYGRIYNTSATSGSAAIFSVQSNFHGTTSILSNGTIITNSLLPIILTASNNHVQINSTLAQSSGNVSYQHILINGTINNTGTYSGTTRGIYYNPNLTSLTGTIHRAIETTTGNVVFNSTSGNTLIGTTTDSGFKLDVNGLVNFTGTTASDGGQLGAELLSASGWTSTDWTGSFATGWTHTTGNTTALTNTLAAVNGTYYQITYTVTGRTAGSFTLAFGGYSGAGITATGNTGPQAISTGTLSITPTTDFDGTIVISIKVITAGSANLTIKNSAGTVINEINGSSSNTNIFVGLDAGSRNTTGLYNTFLGSSSGLNNTNGTDNSFFGYISGQSNTVGSNNTFLGSFAGWSNTTGGFNTFVGSSGRVNTTGNFNCYFGARAGISSTTTSGNCFFGYEAGRQTTGSTNSFYGYQSGTLTTSGSNNAGFGLFSGLNNTTGSNNSFFGSESGRRISSGANLTVSNNSVFLGYDTRANADSETNQLVVGYAAIGLGSNTTVIGNSSTTYGRWWGNLLVGTSTNGGQALQVTGDSYLNGNLGIGSTSLTSTNLRIGKSITGSGVSNGVLHLGVVLNDVSNTARYFISLAGTQAASFTLPNLIHYAATSGTFGLGSSVTNQFGFHVESSLTGASNNYGFYGDISSASGRWNLYMNGNALNYLNGSLLIGTTTDSGYKLDVNGTARVVDNISFGTTGSLRGFVGRPSWDTTYLSVQNATLSISTGNYSLAQSSTGETSINSATGQSLFFKINNVTAFRLASSSEVTFSDGTNLTFNTTTGTKIGTANTQKLSFWNAAPVSQPNTGIAEATFVENSGGTAVNVDSTFAGYTLQQIAQALKDMGILA